VIDVVSDETFEYLTGSEATYGGFDSRLVFDWIPVPDRENQRRNHDNTQPLRFVTPFLRQPLFHNLSIYKTTRTFAIQKNANFRPLREISFYTKL
jgi:hypothetical protein